MSGTPSCVWFMHLEVLVLFIKAIVSGGGCFPLACRRVLLSSGRWLFLLVVLRMFHLVALVPVHSVIVSSCLECILAFIISGLVKFFLSSPYFLKTKNKKNAFFLCL
jgi:hypothetical protein